MLAKRKNETRPWFKIYASTVLVYYGLWISPNGFYSKYKFLFLVLKFAFTFAYGYARGLKLSAIQTKTYWLNPAHGKKSPAALDM